MKKGFTLAEVLITLGIIGVVAAMTIPALIQKNYEKETVARVKKAYSILQQAYLMTSQKNGTPDEWGATGMNEESSHRFLAEKFIPYMKVTKNCVGMTSQEVSKNCTTVFTEPKAYASVKIADGTAIIFRIYDGSCNFVYGTNKQLQNVCGSISIDTNATSKPNKNGYDIFGFYITKTGIFPMGAEFDTIHPMEKYCNISKQWGENIEGYTNGAFCAAWVLYNENLDYLRCELNWHSGKTSCKK